MGSGESKEGAGEASMAVQNGESEETCRSNTAVACAVAAGAALLYYASGSSTQNDKEEQVHKMMKAPGKKGKLIERGRFEEDPRAYYRKLRGKD